MSGHSSSRKRLVASFLQFLSDEIEVEGNDSEMVESIDVARQCLRMAYTTTAEDVPVSQIKLLDLFKQNCPPPVSLKLLSVKAKHCSRKAVIPVFKSLDLRLNLLKIKSRFKGLSIRPSY